MLWERLTPQQRRVCDFLLRGYWPCEAIGKQLGIKARTVKCHLHQVYRLVGLPSSPRHIPSVELAVMLYRDQKAYHAAASSIAGYSQQDLLRLRQWGVPADAAVQLPGSDLPVGVEAIRNQRSLPVHKSTASRLLNHVSNETAGSRGVTYGVSRRAAAMDR